MPDYQRARSQEQKQERMEAIMDAAESLYRDIPYHEINMGVIAKELGWSRSNLYKYAATLEEIFLALHGRANRAYVDDLLEALGDEALTDEEFAQRWAKVTNDHPDFLRYQDILIPIIESNTSMKRLIEFKSDFVKMLAPLLERLRAQVGVDAGEAYELYLRLLFQAPGLYNHFHCNEKTQEALRLAGKEPPKGSFADTYGNFVRMCLAGAR